MSNGPCMWPEEEARGPTRGGVDGGSGLPPPQPQVALHGQRRKRRLGACSSAYRMRVLRALAVTIACVSAALVCAFLLVIRSPATEGFSAAAAPSSSVEQVQEATNRILKRLQRIGGKLADPAVWKERIALMRMTPAQLARKHMREQGALL